VHGAIALGVLDAQTSIRLEQYPRELPATHGAGDVQGGVTVEIGFIGIAKGGEQDAGNSGMSISAGSVQRSIAVLERRL